jgi:RNA binding exosome subunit
MQVEFASVTISFFIHSTEDPDSLISNVSERLRLASGDLQTETVEGHYGNTIICAKAHITGRRAQEVAVTVLHDLSRDAKSKVLLEMEKSMDEHDALFLRIDRQRIDREINLSDEEPIRVKLKPKFRSGGRVSMKERYQELIQ